MLDALSGFFAIRFGGRCSIEGEGRGRWKEIGSEEVEACTFRVKNQSKERYNRKSGLHKKQNRKDHSGQ